MTDLSECCAILYHISFYISSQDEKIKKYFDTTIMIIKQNVSYEPYAYKNYHIYWQINLKTALVKYRH